jgi:hypothetical protein
MVAELPHLAAAASHLYRTKSHDPLCLLCFLRLLDKPQACGRYGVGAHRWKLEMEMLVPEQDLAQRSRQLETLPSHAELSSGWCSAWLLSAVINYGSA